MLRINMPLKKKKDVKKGMMLVLQKRKVPKRKKVLRRRKKKVPKEKVAARKMKKIVVVLLMFQIKHYGKHLMHVNIGSVR